jgi:hypothetical protein
LSYRPWGGGSTICPGRFFAKKAVFIFVAALLARYDVGLEKQQSPFPVADVSKPTPGVAHIEGAEDVGLVLRRRK